MPQNADFLQKMSTSAKLRGLGIKTYFLKLLMCVYLRSKFQVSKIILTSFRQGEFYPQITPSAKQPSTMPTQTIFFCISLSVDDQLVELTY